MTMHKTRQRQSYSDLQLQRGVYLIDWLSFGAGVYTMMALFYFKLLCERESWYNGNSPVAVLFIIFFAALWPFMILFEMIE